MIFYHFTDFYFLQNGGTILQEGLKAAGYEGKNETDQMMAPPDAVWLSTDSEETWGIRRSECRITLVIPSTDRRLVRWEKWLRKKHPPDIAQGMLAACAQTGNSAWKNYWLYLGPVPRSKFRVIEHADQQKRAEAEKELRLHPERRYRWPRTTT